MGTVYRTNGIGCSAGVALADPSERQQERVRTVKHGIIAHRIDPIASEKEEATPLDDKLIESLAYLSRERFDIA